MELPNHLETRRLFRFGLNVQSDLSLCLTSPLSVLKFISIFVCLVMYLCLSFSVYVFTVLVCLVISVCICLVACQSVSIFVCPSVGLQYITEFQNANTKKPIICVCNLCQIKFSGPTLTSHVTGLKHRVNYMVSGSFLVN